MEPFPESAVLGWVLGLSITALVIGGMVVGLIARLWPFMTHSCLAETNKPRTKAPHRMANVPRTANDLREALEKLQDARDRHVYYLRRRA